LITSAADVRRTFEVIYEDDQCKSRRRQAETEKLIESIMSISSLLQLVECAALPRSSPQSIQQTFLIGINAAQSQSPANVLAFVVSDSWQNDQTPARWGLYIIKGHQSYS